MTHLPAILRALPLLSLGFTLVGQTGDTYKDGIQKWRQEREDRLKTERGWLSVAGLFWLSEGENTLGSDPSNKFVLPAGSPSKVGSIHFEKGVATLHAAEGMDVKVGGKPAISGQKLASDASGSPDKITVGALTMTVIQRGERTGIRLYDPNAKTRVDFKGCQWYPIDPAMAIQADWVPYTPAKKIPITNVLGDTSLETCSGYVSFKFGNEAVRLDALDEDDGLFFILQDGTSGKSTYGAGRFLYTDKPKDGHVLVDFNKAENPPCAFTAFATCPLPPKSNRLKIEIPAGEKYSGTHE